MKNLVKDVSNAVSNIKNGTSTVEEKVWLTMLIFLLTLGLIAVVEVRYWIMPLSVVALIGILVYESRPKQQKPSLNLLESAYHELFQVFAQIHDRIGAVHPLDIHDIIVTPPVAMRVGIEFVKVKIAKSKRGTCDPDDLRLIAKIIQARIDDHLRSGCVENIPFVSLDNQVPIFWIDHIYDDAATLYVDIIVVDSNDKLRYVINSQFDQAKQPLPDPTDEDF